MISPDKMVSLAEEVRKTYVELETIILEKITKRLEKGIDTPNWLSIKLSETQKVKEEIEKLLSEFTKNSDSKVLEIVTKVYNDGIRSADVDFENLGLDVKTLILNSPLLSNINEVNAVAINQIVGETNQLINSMNFQILRKSQDMYRDIVGRTSAIVISGVETKRQAVQRTLNEFANKGISGFVDKAGRNWEMSAYADMAVRTAIGRASMAGHEQRIKQLGEDLVIVSNHPLECPICRPYEGQIYSLSGTSTKYQPLSVAKAGGLFHPSCGHVATLFVEGFSDPTPRMEQLTTQPTYEDKQKQRYIERQIRQWKRREAVAITPQDKLTAQNKVKEKQKQMRDFVKQTGLRRKSDREQI
jgi:hypothetical protein